ncbi:hypothetical protein Tco_1196476, partial [Tanacetum coccineum]
MVLRVWGDCQLGILNREMGVGLGLDWVKDGFGQKKERLASAAICKIGGVTDEEEVPGVQKFRPETRDDKSGQNSHKQGVGFRKVKDCFVCKSTNYLIKDCNFHDKKSQESNLKNVVNTGKREGKPVWDKTKRVNHQNFSKYPHLSKTFIPSWVLTRTRFVSTARPSVSTARPVSTTRPSINISRPSYASRSIYPRMDN